MIEREEYPYIGKRGNMIQTTFRKRGKNNYNTIRKEVDRRRTLRLRGCWPLKQEISVSPRAIAPLRC